MKKNNKETKRRILLALVIFSIIISIFIIGRLKTPIDRDAFIGNNAASDDNMSRLRDGLGISQVKSLLSKEDLSRISEKSRKYKRAIELVSPDGYINTDYINISQQLGKNI